MTNIINRKFFWNIISKARLKYKNNNDINTYLTHYLKEKSNEEIFNFAIILDELLLESYNDRLWCSCYLINADISEDSFDFFRLWLISKGKDIYEEILMNPDNLVDYINNPEDNEIKEEYYENEDFFFIASEAYTLKNISETTNIEDTFEIYLEAFDEYKEKIGYIDIDYPKIKFTWNENDTSTIEKICPKLYNKLYKND